jgi:ATPase family associated with various cellular activities (AAA)
MRRRVTSVAAEPAVAAGLFVAVAERVHRAVAGIAATDPHPSDPFRGLYVSDEAALALASGTTADGFDERIASVGALLGLEGLDLPVLALCAAPELDPRFGRLLAYLHDDVTRRLASPRLAARLLTDDPAQSDAVLGRFGVDAPLRRLGAVRLLDGEPTTPVAERLVKVDDRLAGHLLGVGLAASPPGDRLVHPSAPDPGRAAAVGELRAALDDPAFGVALLAVGADAAELLATARGGPVLVAPAREAASPEAAAAAGLRAALAGAALCFDLDDLSPDDQAGVAAAIGERGAGALLCARRPDAVSAIPGLRALAVSVPEPGLVERRALWRAQVPGADVDGVAARFRLSMAQIAHAAEVAGASARARGNGSPDARDLERGARDASRTRLGALAVRVEPRAGWSDLVLPAEPLELLRSVAAFLRHRDLVLSEWGYGRAVAGGQGLKVLFAGESGTGKTMAAGVIAGDLGLDLFRIDLATVVSKYIGETEQNLDRIFAAAEGSNALLLFDEADALFGKRSEVKDAHDRYANIEVAYLLQRMEAYAGAVILATNLRSNMDDAFLRRLDVLVEFPFPEPADRRRLWRALVPAEAPVADDVDLDLLADRFRLTGGSIRNCSVTAAFLAADEGVAIGMPQLLRAVAQELRKQGRLTLEADFAGLTTGAYAPARRS